MAEDFVYVPAGGKDQFLVQDWFRNITVGFQPYIPFSQAYRMKLQNEIVMTQAKGTRGYMHYAPADEPGEEEDLHTLKQYPWNEPGGRLDAFMGRGAGRLATMSTKPFNRMEVALGQAAELGGEVEMTKLGRDFTDVLDSLSPGDLPQHFSPASSRVHQEIMIRMIEEMAEDVSLTPQSEFTDRSGMLGKMSPRDPIQKRGTGSEFDVYLERTRSFGDFLEDKMSDFKGDVTLEGLDALNLEVSRAAAREGGSKLFTAFDTSNIANEDLKEEWTKWLKQVVNSMNDDMLSRWEGIQGRMTMEDNQHTKLSAIRDTYMTPKQGQAHGLSGMELDWNAEMREILQRMMSDVKLTELRSTMQSTTHLWSAPLSKNTAGLTWFYPDFHVGGENTGVPKIGWDESHVFTFTAISGDIIMAYIDWMKQQGHITPLEALEITNKAAVEAGNFSVATQNRINAMGSSVYSFLNSMDLNPEMTVQMQTLQPTEIAEELGRQLAEYYSSGQMKSELRLWYEQLMEESNRITNVWKARMAKISNTRGTSNLHREYIIGDELGNPRKHYLGVWGDVMEPTWKGAGEGASGDVGYNLSIAPFITSRRRGVAKFGQ